MDVKSAVFDRKKSNIVTSLEIIRNELKNITLPLRISLNPKGRERKALIYRVAMLTDEVEDMLAAMGEKKGVELLKAYTNRVREIIDEKELISNKLKEFKDLEQNP